ncbi:hypothetical protein, partial [Bacteroides oleiciplenus]|uniref:hypothetical protein n=1 Tax=Bacteroides oleiciplenus TaxID=626931 RepID=UPI0026DCB4D0
VFLFLCRQIGVNLNPYKTWNDSFQGKKRQFPTRKKLQHTIYQQHIKGIITIKIESCQIRARSRIRILCGVGN